MDAIRTHQFYFDKQMILRYDKFKKFCIPENYFEFTGLPKMAFIFGGFTTYWSFNPITNILYHTKPIDILIPDSRRWRHVDKKIREYPVTGQI